MVGVVWVRWGVVVGGGGRREEERGKRRGGWLGWCVWEPLCCVSLGVSQAPCAFVSVFRHGGLCVVTATALSQCDLPILQGRRRILCPCSSLPWVWTDRLPETQLSTCGCHCCTDRHLSCWTRPSVAPSVRGAIGRTLWPEKDIASLCHALLSPPYS